MTPEELAKRMSPQEIYELRQSVLRRITLTVEGNAKRVTPVRTGNLRRSITSTIEDAGWRGRVGTNVVYARPVHNRKPFLKQGLEMSREAINKLLEESGDQLWQRMVKN